MAGKELREPLDALIQKVLSEWSNIDGFFRFVLVDEGREDPR